MSAHLPASLWRNPLPRLLAVTLIVVVAASNSPTAWSQVTERHRQLADEVLQRLLAVVERPEKWDAWPPQLEIIDADEPNASAGFEEVDGKRIPTLTLNRGEIEQVAAFNADALAFTLGHELGHLLHYHSFEKFEVIEGLQGRKLPLMILAVTRENELEADLTGVQLALKAGFSREGLKKNLMSSRAQGAYCGIRALGISHPSWDERIAFVEDDAQQKQLWHSMAAFDNGVFLLQTQQFAHAEYCFRKVVEEFPKCYEGWANLGYAQLMRYCDALESEDLKTFEIGQLVVGGFYERPASLLAQVRGVDEDLWFDAVGSLREAIRLGNTLKQPDPLVLAKANLAIAYLVRPAGKDVGQAERLFSEVIELLNDPQIAATVDPLTRAAIFVNASAGRELEESIAEATKQIAGLEASDVPSGPVASLNSAVRYQQAALLMRSPAAADQSRAFELLEAYLSSMRSTNAWWPLAYEHYVELAESLERTPKARQEFASSRSKKWRPTTQVPLADDLTVMLGAPTDEALQRLGDPSAVVPIVQGTNLKLYKYAPRGLTVLAGSTIVAILLEGDTAPQLTLRRPEISGDTATLAIGMPRKEFEKLLGDEWDASSGFLHDPTTAYQIYGDAGIAVRFKAGVVIELAVIVAPRT